MLRKCNLAGCLCLLWLLTGIDQAQGQGNQPRSSRQSPLTQVTASQPAADTTEVEEPDTTRLGSGIERKAATKPFSLRDREIERYAGFWTPYRQRISPLLGKPFSQKIELDSSGKFYYLQPRIGNLNHRLPMRVPYRQLEQARTAELYQQYFRTLSRAADGTDPVKVSNRLIPPIKLPPLVNRLFGGDQIDLQPNGSIMLDLGGKWQRVENPQILLRQQRNGGLFFDQQIQLNSLGKIGSKLNLNFNWDTKSLFQFDNTFLTGYTGQEEDIIQEVKVGNVSMPVSNGLITGGQNLFGVKTRLRFGKLWISAIASQSRGTVETMRIRGGAQVRHFEIRADSYDENRHFFLGQFFRHNYEPSLKTIPVITSGVVVTRVEVYVTNRNNNTQTLRNIVALLDLGEGQPFRANNPHITPAAGRVPTDNAANRLFTVLESNPHVRDPDQLSQVLEQQLGLVRGTDYEMLRGARKLQPNEFVLHPHLGYISLVTPLRNDEILAVSFEYTYNGKVYRVGELTENYQNRPNNDIIILKMLRPSTIRRDLPTWDLMMKNIYSLQTQPLERTNFRLQIVYRDDATGIDNPSLHEGANLKDVPLVQVMRLDLLNPNNDPQPDGNIDFIEGITVDSRNGRIIFPVLEPFGSHLEKQFIPQLEQQLINQYVFNELYRGTRMDAMLLTSKSKFFLKGSYQSASSGEIRLNGINIARNSVQVRAGGTLLTEGTDYTVDYQMGTVRITNAGILSSGKEIVIQYERQDMFNFQTRNLVGTDVEYRFNNNFRVHTTLMHLNERPNITRVSIGTEPTRNTLWGLGLNYRKESRWLTRMIDALPLVSTKAPSTVAFSSDFAQIIPGANQLIAKNGGTSFIDDFEGAEVPYELGRQPQAWALGSTPEQFRPLNSSNPLEYSYRRARLAWYTVDNTVFFNRGLGQSPPGNITQQDRCNHYVRPIAFDEIFRGRDPQMLNNPDMTMDLAFYPDERGMYNYNPNLTPEGRLPNPRQNFGAITRGITHDIDFDNINIQYIEFWLLDPFIRGVNGQIVRNVNGRNIATNNTTGGKLFFNLGNISEDYIPDGRHGFENGLPTNDSDRDTVRTAWGIVTRKPYLTNAFAAEPGARARQDVGMDGLNDQQERTFFRNYLNQVRGRVSGAAYASIERDPSGDNFAYYLSDEATAQDLKVFDRYKFFNGMEGNSPEGAGTQSNSFLPDNEDLNRDNTLNQIDAYYEYEIDLRPGQLENNPFVVDRVVTSSRTSCNENVTWYLFRIPIRNFTRKVGDINDFKSIRFIRIYLTDWQEPVVLRMAHFQFIGSQWRPFLESLEKPGLQTPREPARTILTVSSVNIEENGPEKTESGRTPYVLPPGFIRDLDFASNTQARRNEQSLRLCVENLADRDARAVYKNYIVDMVNYQRIKMFVHVSPFNRFVPLNEGDIKVFVRFGTDFTENYYEIEMPSIVTPLGTTIAEEIWPEENSLDIAVMDLVNAKAERNRLGLSLRLPYITHIDRFQVTVVGNPDLSNVQTIMIGIRNPESQDGKAHSACIWVNELRVAGFNRQPGWAVQARLNATLADLAILNASMRYASPFFGGIQDKISQRTREHSLEYDIASTVQLHKLGLERVGFSIPMFVSYERRLTTPYFNPLDPDMPLKLALQTRPNAQALGLAHLVREETIRRSLNFTNVRKTKLRQDAKNHLWDVENFAFNLAYSDAFNTNIRTAEYIERFTKIGLQYNYNNSTATPLEPFKRVVFLDAPYLKFLKDFNINPLPASITFSGDIDRRFIKTQLRNSDLNTFGISPFFEKAFTFNRSYNVRWSLTRSLGMDYTAQAFSIIDEPAGEINNELVDSRRNVTRRDSVINNLLRLGRMKNFVQTIGVQYDVPFRLFPATDWLNANARYQAGYTWTAGAIGIADTLGNTMQNNNNLRITGQMNMRTLYNKSPLLRSLTSSNKQQAQQAPTEVWGQAKKRRLQTRIERNKKRRSKLLGETPPRDASSVPDSDKPRQRRYQAKIDRYEGNILELVFDSARYSKRIHRYRNKIERWKKKLNLIDSPKLTKQEITLDSTKLKKKIKKIDRRIERLHNRLAQVEARQKAKTEQPPKPTGAVATLARLLTSVQNVQFNYDVTHNTLIPGVLTVPRFLGMDRNFINPGWAFILGGQNPDIKSRLAQNGAISVSPFQNNSFTQGRNSNLQVTANLSPLRDFDLRIEWRKITTGNYSEVFRFNPAIGKHESQSPMRNGQYSVSFNILPTAFARDNSANISPIFDQFIANREIIRRRLETQIPGAVIEPNSQDVLIPAFIAAYTGKSADRQPLSAFPRIPLPNWQLTFTGLTQLDFFKQYFRQIQVRHSYKSEYNVGSFTSSLFYGADFLQLNIREHALPLPLIDPVSQTIVPILVMSQVNIDENFSPLLGLNMRTTKNMTITLNYNKRRTLGLTLNNAQVSEMRSDDLTMDVGFTKANLRIPFKINGSYIALKNDLTFRMSFTVRDTRTVQRRIQDGIQESIVTMGNYNLQLRPTLNYVINQQVSIQFYFDRQINNPRVSNSFRRTNTAFGFQVRFNLSQL
ncbi:MAG: cell surface protein SprA [Cytophagales bacterium]|nr:cell surface protein SprA [Bernardetiaceae bacterium]MDW8211021.1 cell surface protein SprA [Cytophagales bacterium]